MAKKTQTNPKDVESIQKIVDCVLFDNIQDLSFESLYRRVYTICLSQAGNDELYDILRKVVLDRKIIFDKQNEIKKNNDDGGEEVVVDDVEYLLVDGKTEKKTINWAESLDILDDIFMYLYKIMETNDEDKLSNCCK